MQRPARRREVPAADPLVRPQAGASGPVAVYARILDGDSLWLAVTGTDERVGLRHEPTGQVLEPDNDAPPDPAVASYRWHLPSVLPPLADGVDHDAFVVVTIPSGAQVRAEALPDADPMRTPPSRDGLWQLDVRRREGGAVAIRRERRGPVAEVVAIDQDDEGVTLTVTAPDAGTAAWRLLVVDGDDQPVGQVPMTADERGLTVTLAATDVPQEVGPHWFLAVATADGEQVPVQRPANDSARPGHSTVLPFLWSEDADGGRSMVRLQYQHEGRIRVNRLGADERDTA